MKIAFIVTTFPTLSETFILNQIVGLLDLGHEVDVYASHKGNSTKVHPDIIEYSLLDKTFCTEIPSNRLLRVIKCVKLLSANFYKKPLGLLNVLNFIKYGKQAASLNLFYMALTMMHRNKSYDIIHAHFGQNGLKACILRELGFIQGKVATAFHGNDITTYIKKEGEHVYDLLFELGDVFLPISKRWEERLIELGCGKDKTVVHRMGVNSKKFPFSLQDPHNNSNPAKIVSIARLVEKKGIEYGICAVAKLKDSHTINYTIVGDGSLRENLQKLINNLNVNGIVSLVGWKQQEEIIKILQNGDILLAPSITSESGDQEGIPVVLMETMAIGLPVVSTFHSGIPELIESGKSGFLVPERNSDALAEKLSYLIEHPEVRNDMSLAGRKFVEINYNIDRLNNQLVQIYQDMLSS